MLRKKNCVSETKMFLTCQKTILLKGHKHMFPSLVTWLVSSAAHQRCFLATVKEKGKARAYYIVSKTIFPRFAT